jgi:esterase/lipase superfamily enzyme
MNALSDELLSLLDEIRAALARGEMPEALLARLESLWQAERPDDSLGLKALLKSLRVEPAELPPELETSEDEFDEESSQEESEEEASRHAFDAESWESSKWPLPDYLLGPSKADEIADEGWVYPVYFGTNRRRTAAGFLAERATSVTYGRADVFIPKDHRFGESGTPWYKRWLQGRFRDDHLRLKKTDVLGEADFWQALKAEMARGAAGGKPHGLVYLHGYCNDFKAAAIRAAQIGFDLKVSGATAFFSWPSQGAFKGYPADAAAIEASEAPITQFLADFVRQSGAAVVHLVAHSMGNRGLLRALQRLAADAELMAGAKFGQIFLAAPDVDSDLFLSLAELYPKFSTRTTLYASHKDKAVAMSAWLHSAARAGYYFPITETKLEKLNTILVPDFDIDLLGHSYFAQADALLHDIFDQMAEDKPPGKRQRLLAEGDHWVMQR